MNRRAIAVVIITSVIIRVVIAVIQVAIMAGIRFPNNCLIPIRTVILSLSKGDSYRKENLNKMSWFPVPFLWNGTHHDTNDILMNQNRKEVKKNGKDKAKSLADDDS